MLQKINTFFVKRKVRLLFKTTGGFLLCGARGRTGQKTCNLETKEGSLLSVEGYGFSFLRDTVF